MGTAVARMRPLRSAPAARDFFARFYEWSVACSSSVPNRALHTCGYRPVRSRISVPSQVRHHSNPFKPSPENPPAPGQDDKPEEPALSTHLRKLMRTLPHPVVVCTSTQPSIDRGTPPKYRGMTLSSFTTLTLTPDPIVTFNIRKPSSTLDAIRESGSFYVHVLNAGRSGVDVANAFTKGNGREAPGLGDVFKQKEFVVLKMGKGSTGPPLLAAEGITRVLRCEVLEEADSGGLVEVGDHVLVLGKVVGILVPPGKEDDELPGLGYADGKYRGLGEVLEVL